jgi:hypothetical protein
MRAFAISSWWDASWQTARQSKNGKQRVGPRYCKNENIASVFELNVVGRTGMTHLAPEREERQSTAMLLH